jgi:type II secretory pathway pseudopilin PulG
MTWFLITVLAVVVVLALLAVLALASLLIEDDEAAERARIEMEVRRAEHRLHDIARNSFEAMLDEARSHSPGRTN